MLGLMKVGLSFYFQKILILKEYFLFEPSPINFENLLKNKESIRLKFKNLDIVLENYALGNEKKKLFIKQLPESSSSTINKIDEHSKYFKKKIFLEFIEG